MLSIQCSTLWNTITWQKSFAFISTKRILAKRLLTITDSNTTVMNIQHGPSDRVRVSGGHLCAQHRSTDRGDSRDIATCGLLPSAAASPCILRACAKALRPFLLKKCHRHFFLTQKPSVGSRGLGKHCDSNEKATETKRFRWLFGAVVLNGFEKINFKQLTISHIFLPYQIGTLVFSKTID